jgi:hypothetical protein
METCKVTVSLKDEKFPYFYDDQINIIDAFINRGKRTYIFVSGRFVKQEGEKKYIEFERVNRFGLKLDNAKLVRTEKGTLVIRHEPGSTLYVVEIPSGKGGRVEYEIKSGECYEITPKGQFGYFLHLYCNGNAEISYKIDTWSYEYLGEIFGRNLDGVIKVKDGKIEVLFDEEVDRLVNL